VRNQFAGATVTIASIGADARILTRSTAASSDTRFDLPPGIALKAGDLLVAMQEFGGDSSPAPASGMQLAIPVQRAPGAPSDLVHVGFASTLWECGRHLWLKGGVPGAEGTVVVVGSTIGSGTFFESEGARFRLNDALSIAPVEAGQSVPAIGAGPTTSRVPQPLPGDRNDRLPAPMIDPPPLACQSAVRVGNIFDGAEVVLERSDGKSVTQQRAGFDLSALWAIHRSVGPLTQRRSSLNPPYILNPPGPSINQCG
jgi:hypothetical protein